MRFLVDAQLPVRLASRLGELGHEVLHTSSLPDGNRTTDQQIAAFADQEGRVVVTKDADFRNSHLLTGSPAKLLVVATGNIRNRHRARASAESRRVCFTRPLSVLAFTVGAWRTSRTTPVDRCCHMTLG